MKRLTCLHRHLNARYGLVLSALLFAGCSMVPTYERPPAPVAAQWPQAPAAPAEQARPADQLPWQDFVRDAGLRELMAMALANNRDLRVALQNIELARAQYQIRRADQSPTLNANLGYARSSATSTLATSAGLPVDQRSFSAGLGVASWELDLFGRVAALKQQALAQYLASEEARKAAQISLVASVASAWLSLQSDRQLLDLAQRNLSSREQSLALIRLRLDQGVASGLDLRLAESLQASTAAAVAQQKRLLSQDINLLTLLVGQSLPDRLLTAPTPSPAGQATATASSDEADFAPLLAGLPSEVLLRRPDVRAAEEQLVAANANIGAARAAFWPRISLTANLGFSSRQLDQLFDASSRAWSFAPSLVQPIFDLGRNQANLDAAKAQRAIVLATYEKTVQTAFREVADALAGRAELGAQLQAVQAQLSAERERFHLADLRLQQGLASDLDKLDAERALLAAEQTFVQVQALERANQVALYKALGGGWSEPATQAGS